MPNFKKSTGYKMKGSKFYGAGNQSPLKAVDSAVIDSQKELNKTEDTFRQPGWARVAGSVEKMAKGPLGRFKDKIMGDGGTKTSSTTSSVKHQKRNRTSC
jgi:hypothetical protein